MGRKEEKDAEDIRKKLTKAKLVIGKDAVLPENSCLARAICELAINNDAVSAADLWQAHEHSLRQRLANKDRHALHLLCHLAANADNGEIAELDRLGWKKWNAPEFAVSYIAGLVGDNKITSLDDKELVEAFAALPEDGYLNRIRARLAGREKLTRELLIDLIKSEYRKLSTGTIIPDSYTLNAFFDELGKKL